MNWQKLSHHLTSAGLALIVLLAYQNCSQTHFASDLDSAVLKAETMPGEADGVTPGDDGQIAKTPETPDKGKPPSQDLVECQLLHPNMKVVLDYQFLGQHGNSSSVRVCMSTHACLKLVNAFAVQHSCSVDASIPAAQADAGRQCTEIFPGSKGTCHNAAVLTDAQVTELLKKMASQ